MKKTLSTIGAVLLLAAVYSSAQDCPICPGGTNGPGGGSYTNNYVPPSWPSNSMLIRVASIYGNDGTTLLYTNYGWAHDTNGNIIMAGASAFDSAAAASFSSLIYTLAITNSMSSRVYTIEYSTNLSSFWQVGINPPIYGSMDGSEVTQAISVPNIGGYPAYFWKPVPLAGFISYGVGAKKAQGMGQFFGCPSVYVGFVDFTNSTPGVTSYYQVDTNWNQHSVADLYRPTNHIQLFFPNGLDCNVGVARATNAGSYQCWPRVFFENNYPTQQVYRLWFQGFVEPTP